MDTAPSLRGIYAITRLISWTLIESLCRSMAIRKSIYPMCALVWMALQIPAAHAFNLYVDGSTGNDNQNRDSFIQQGSTTPLKTIQKAVNIARYGDTIYVAPGVYREQVYIDPAHLSQDGAVGSATNRLCIKNWKSEKPIIKASVQITGWSQVADPVGSGLATDSTAKIYEVTWNVLPSGTPQSWAHNIYSVFEVPENGTPSTESQPLQKIGFHDLLRNTYTKDAQGNPTQTTEFSRLQNSAPGFPDSTRSSGSELSKMTAGSFKYDTATHKLYVWRSDSKDPNTCPVEAVDPTRPSQSGIPIASQYPYTTIGPVWANADYIQLEGLKLRHSNVAYSGVGPSILVGDSSVIKDCDIQYMDYVAVGTRFGSNNVEVIDSVISNNGCLGLNTIGIGSKILRCTIEHNNWQDWPLTWDAGAIKQIRYSADISGMTISDNTIRYNKGPAIWLDGGIRSVSARASIERNFCYKNESGVFFEFVRGVDIADNIIVANNTYGIYLTWSGYNTVRHNTVIVPSGGNYTGAVALLLLSPGRTEAASGGWDTRDNVVEYNIFASYEYQALVCLQQDAVGSAHYNNVFRKNALWNYNTYFPTHLQVNVFSPVFYGAFDNVTMAPYYEVATFQGVMGATASENIKMSPSFSGSIASTRAPMPNRGERDGTGNDDPSHYRVQVTSGAVGYGAQRPFEVGTGVFSPDVASVGISLNGKLVARFVEGDAIPNDPEGDKFGQMLMDAGTDDRPGYGFDGDDDTGIYHAGADTIGFAAGGVPKMTVGPAGVTIGDGSPTGTGSAVKLVKSYAFVLSSQPVGANQVVTINSANTSVPGAQVGDAVSLGLPPGVIGTKLQYTAVVTDANTVKIQAYNPGTAQQSTVSGTYRVVVFQFGN